jgi:hypothetical protein
VWLPDRWSLLVFVSSLILYVALSRYLTQRLQLTGDEPWYLLLGYGLLHNHSIDLTPLFQDPHIYTQFGLTGPDGLHAADYRGNGELILYYLPGYALVSGVGYLLAGRMGVLIVQAALAALTCLLLYRHTSAFFQSRATGIFAWLVFIFALPPLVFVAQVFPSAIASFLAFGAFLLLIRMSAGDQQKNTLLIAALLGAIAAVLPWLHSKYALLAAVLVAMTLLCLRPWRSFRGANEQRRTIWLASACVTAIPLLSFALIALYDQRAFGTWTPKYSVSASDAASLANFDPARGLALYADMFLGNQSGLIVWAPVFALALPGVVLLARRDRRQAGLLLGCVLGLLGAFFSAFFTPSVSQAYALPARFCVECAPFFALCAAAVFAPAWTSLRSWLNSRSRTQDTPYLRSAQRNWASVGLLIALLFLLVTSAWFTLIGLRTPEYLYPSAAGNRIALKYANRLPTWWFGLFPDFTQIVKHSGSVNLMREAASTSDAQTGQATITWSNSTALAEIPPGEYLAAYTITCDANSAPVSSSALTLQADRLAGATHTPVGQRDATLPTCAGGQAVQFILPFSSVGYEPVEFLLTQPETATIASVQISYQPA